MAWVRLHKPPKKARDRRTPKQCYLFNKSMERYLKTKDGMCISTLCQSMEPEIGYVDSVRFIVT